MNADDMKVETFACVFDAIADTPEEAMTSLDATTFDRTVRPQDDLFRYVNGPWLREAQIPEDKALIGAFVVLRDRAEEAVREIVTEEPGEDPEGAARREVAEETGLRAGRMERIGRFMLMQGGCDEVMHYYAARVSLPAPEEAGTGGLEAEGEDTRVVVLPAAEAFRMVDDNRIENVTAGFCLLWLRHHRERLRREWAA